MVKGKSLAVRKYKRHLEQQKDLDNNLLGDQVSRKLSKFYKKPIGLADCHVCYNPLREDSYADCQYFCPYCFARDKTMSLYSAFYSDWEPDMVRPAAFKQIEQEFTSAINATRKNLSGNALAIRQGVPFHMGVLSDPFQPREPKHGVSLRFLKLMKEYDYPVIISTKSTIPWYRPEYRRAILDLDKVIYQSSITTLKSDLSKKLEPGAPLGETRADALSKFKECGIRTVARIQPVVPFITDKYLYDTLEGLADRVDIVNCRDHFMSGNKTLRQYWVDTFGIDLWEVYGASSDRTLIGGQRSHNKVKVLEFLVKAKVTANSFGLKYNLDTCYGFNFTDMHHCCGGDGLKGFNPHNYWDLRKAKIFNTFSQKFWIKYLAKKKRLDYNTAFNQAPYNTYHKNLMENRWLYAVDLLDSGLIRHDQIPSPSTALEDIEYKYDPQAFLKRCIRYEKENIGIEPGEQIEDNIPKLSQWI